MPNALTILLGGVDITTKVDQTSVVMQLAGSQEIGTCEFDIVDEGLTVAADAESTLSVTEVSSATVLFGGFTRSPRVVLTATGRLIHIKAVDYNSLLDRSIVVSDSRTAGESDHARLVYLMTTYGTQFSSDYSQIATLKASMPAQKFIAITLRQAIERVLGQASTKSSYMVDATGRLITYDRSVPVAAPFDIRIGTPGAGEIAPEDFAHDRDSDNLANAIYVVGMTAAGSGWFTDVTSIGTYGRRERFFNAPDSDTHAKAMQVGLAVLEDQKDPMPRATFTTQSPNDGWRIGQTITVNSAQDNLVNEPFRIAKVTTKYLDGIGTREYDIELGAPQRTLSALLASAHGGGGGFPWHSPGGAGGWAPVFGSGSGGVSGGGSCACNTPYDKVIFDNYNRTVAASSWGTSTYGAAWSNSGSIGSGRTISVNGTQGVLGWSAVATGTWGATTAAIAGPWVAPVWTMTVTFNAPSVIYTAASGDFSYLKLDIVGTARLYMGFSSGGDPQAVQMENSYFPFAWSAGATYYVEWNLAYNGTEECRIWLTSDTRPALPLISVERGPTGDDPPATAALKITAQLFGTTSKSSSILLDEIDFGAGVPNSGQTYPWTLLGYGNTVITAFTALTPFRPRSLEVRVDSNAVTPLSEDPVSGGFVLPYPPSAIEAVWAKWVAA